MSLEEMFLRDIHERPDEDGPRLILADWLEDNGDPDRAEFIRLQCRLARGVADPAQAVAEQRVAELLVQHERRWLGELWSPALHWQFHRGLVERLAHTGLFRAVGAAYHQWLRFYPDGVVLSV